MLVNSVLSPAAVVVGLYLSQLPVLMIVNQEQRLFSKYENPSIYGGLFYVVGSRDKLEERALVISYDDKPIAPKANDPDAPTMPGFYLSHKQRYEFESIEVIKERVHFKTRKAGRVSYEFYGSAGEEIVANFHPSMHVPFIRGTLTKFKDGKVLRREVIKFGHAVIA